MGKLIHVKFSHQRLRTQPLSRQALGGLGIGRRTNDFLGDRIKVDFNRWVALGFAHPIAIGSQRKLSCHTHATEPSLLSQIGVDTLQV